MGSRTRGFRWSVWVSGALLLAATAGCTTGGTVPERVLGSPSHHVENGLKLIEKGRLDAAHREFRMALDLDPRYAPAHRGEAFVCAIRLDFDSAFKACHRAIRHTSSKDISDLSLNAFNRFGSLRCDRGALRRAAAGGETACLARLFVVEFLNGYYKLGVTFKFGGDHAVQDEALERALAFTNTFSEKAYFNLESGRRLQEMAPDTELGRGVAFLDRVSRGEAAALLVREIDLRNRLGKSPDRLDGPAEDSARLMDLNGHPLKDDICLFLAFGIDGFRQFEDGSFRPNSPMRRFEYANAVADIVSRIDRDGELTRRRPRLNNFDDVPQSYPGFRAVQACVDMGILKAEGGKFRPAVPLSGMEAAHSIRRIKELLGSD